MVTDRELIAARKPPEELPSWTQDPATEPQIRYIKGLVESRVVPIPWQEKLTALLKAGLKKGDAGNVISSLKTLPVREGQDDRSKNNPTIQDVPPGRYAVHGDDENDVKFYRVKEAGPKKKPYRIILQLAGPNEHLLTGQIARNAVKRIIRFGLGNAAVLYGRKIGRCSQCNTRITNRLSRELGIGPICGGRVYGDWEERVNRARTTLREQGIDPNERCEPITGRSS